MNTVFHLYNRSQTGKIFNCFQCIKIWDWRPSVSLLQHAKVYQCPSTDGKYVTALKSKEHTHAERCITTGRVLNTSICQVTPHHHHYHHHSPVKKYINTRDNLYLSLHVTLAAGRHHGITTNNQHCYFMQSVIVHTVNKKKNSGL